MEEILDKEPLDLKVVETHLKKAEALMTGIHLASIKAGEELKAILTQPQKEVLKSLHRMGPRRGLLPGHRRMPTPGGQEKGRPGDKPGIPRKWSRSAAENSISRERKNPGAPVTAPRSRGKMIRPYVT